MPRKRKKGKKKQRAQSHAAEMDDEVIEGRHSKQQLMTIDKDEDRLDREGSVVINADDKSV